MDRAAFQPGPLAEVYAQLSEGRWTVVFVRDLRHPPEKVWAALTEPAQLAQWAPYNSDRNLASPGAATLTMIDGDTAVDGAAVVSRAEPLTLLEYTWGDDLLRWELEPSATGTRLTLRHTVQDRDWIPKVTAGWHICLDVAEHLLDGDPVGPIRGSEALNFGWAELHDAYARKLRNEA